MRKVVVYYAWDDTEFDNEMECADYERQTIALIKEIHTKMVIFDKDRNYIAWEPISSIENWIEWFSITWGTVYFIHIKEDLSPQAEGFIRAEWGYIFPNEFGTWKYNFDWDRIGD